MRNSAFRLEGRDQFHPSCDPTTDDRRLPKVLSNTSGFVYYVSITGIPAPPRRISARSPRPSKRIKAQTPLPVAVGFGVKTPSMPAPSLLGRMESWSGLRWSKRCGPRLTMRPGDGPDRAGGVKPRRLDRGGGARYTALIDVHFLFAFRVHPCLIVAIMETGTVSGETDNLVLSILREMRGELREMKAELKAEFKGEIARIDTRSTGWEANGIRMLKSFVGHRSMVERAVADVDGEIAMLKRRVTVLEESGFPLHRAQMSRLSFRWPQGKDRS